MDRLENQIHIIQNFAATHHGYDNSGYYRHALSHFGTAFACYSDPKINHSREKWQVVYSQQDNGWIVNYMDAETRRSRLKRTVDRGLSDLNYTIQNWWMPAYRTILRRLQDAVRIIQAFGEYYTSSDYRTAVTGFNSQTDGTYFTPELDRQVRASVREIGHAMFSAQTEYDQDPQVNLTTIQLLKLFETHIDGEQKKASEQETTYRNRKIRDLLQQQTAQGHTNLVSMATHVINQARANAGQKIGMPPERFLEQFKISYSWESFCFGLQLGDHYKKLIGSQNSVTITHQDFWTLPGMEPFWRTEDSQASRIQFLALITLGGYFDLWPRTMQKIYQTWLSGTGKPPTFEACLPFDYFYGTYSRKFDPCQIPVDNQNAVVEFLEKYIEKVKPEPTNIVSSQELYNRDRHRDDVGEAQQLRELREKVEERRNIGQYTGEFTQDAAEFQKKEGGGLERVNRDPEKFVRFAPGTGESEGSMDAEPYLNDNERQLGEEKRTRFEISQDGGVVVEFGAKENAFVVGGLVVVGAMVYFLTRKN